MKIAPRSSLLTALSCEILAVPKEREAAHPHHQILSAQPHSPEHSAAQLQHVLPAERFCASAKAAPSWPALPRPDSVRDLDAFLAAQRIRYCVHTKTPSARSERVLARPVVAAARPTRYFGTLGHQHRWRHHSGESGRPRSGTPLPHCL